jgi:hypothetical protein
MVVIRVDRDASFTTWSGVGHLFRMVLLLNCDAAGPKKAAWYGASCNDFMPMLEKDTTKGVIKAIKVMESNT